MTDISIIVDKIKAFEGWLNSINKHLDEIDTRLDELDSRLAHHSHKEAD
jgi:hypothetical protein